MSESILDGKGKGYKAGVTPDNRLDVSARVDTRMSYVSRDDGEAYFYYSDITPVGADDVVCYIKNTSTTKDLHITWMRTYCASADALDVYLGEVGTPIGGTAIVPVILNQGKGNNAEGVIQEGANITGLSGGSQLDRVRMEAGKDSFTEFHGLILGQNDVFTLRALTGTAAMEVTIGMYYE